MKKVIIRQYRCFEPINFDQDVIEHLYLQNKMWNNLVEYEQTAYDRYREIMATDEQVAAFEAQITAADKQISHCIDERNKIRVQIRKKRGPETEFLDSRISELKKELKATRLSARLARKAARERVKPLLQELNQERREAYKKIYNESGLYWGNYNRVLDSLKIALSRTMKTGGRLRFHRFDATGIFKVQIQGGCTVAELTTGAKSCISLTPVTSAEFDKLINRRPSRRDPNSSRSRRRSYALLKFTIYRGQDDSGQPLNRTLDLPVLIHRPLPETGPELLLKEATLNREQLGPGQYRWHITLTFTEPAAILPIHPHPEKKAGLNLGWKELDTGFRIATLDDGSTARHFMLPPAIINTYAYLRQLQGEIDDLTNDNIAWINEIFPDKATDPEPLTETLTRIRRACRPHPEQFSRIVYRWDRDLPDFRPEEISEALARADYIRQKRVELANLRDKVQARREDLYRNWAADIVGEYGHLTLDEMDLSYLALVEKPDGTPTELHQLARRNRVIASVGLFREWLIKQAAKTGTEIEKIAIKSTTTCATCGAALPRPTTLTQTCAACGTTRDQDKTAAQNLNQTATAVNE